MSSRSGADKQSEETISEEEINEKGEPANDDIIDMIDDKDEDDSDSHNDTVDTTGPETELRQGDPDKDSSREGSDLRQGDPDEDSSREGSDPEENDEDELGLDDDLPGKMHIALNLFDLMEENPPGYTSASPPSYNPRRLMDKILTAKVQSKGNADFAMKVFGSVCCGTVCSGINIALYLAIPIAMIVMGSIYLHSCPRQKYIPIYLIVGGCFGVVNSIIKIADQIRKKSQGNKSPGTVSGKFQQMGISAPNPADGVVSCFLMAWFIAGCYWIYSIHKDYQSEDATSEDYCHDTLYQFAFWLTTASFILIGLALCCCCVLCIGMCVIAAKVKT